MDTLLSVTDLHRAITGAIDSQVGEVWVAGEIISISARGGPHMYFEIAEKRGPQKQVVGTLACAIMAPMMANIKDELNLHGVTMEVGVPVKLHGKAELYYQKGALTFKIDRVDAAWTLGQMVADKDALLRKLQSQGLIEKQKKTHVMPEVPLKIGLVTADGSAAYADFTDELAKSGISFEVMLSNTTVQGPEAPRQIQQALVMLAKQTWKPEVVAVVRGGGSKNDLAAFDTEIVARTIALAPWPVIVGVGHEVDRSICDEVAYYSFKTPTATAAALVGKVKNFHEALEKKVKATGRTLDRKLQSEEERQGKTMIFIEKGAIRGLEKRGHHIEKMEAALTASAMSALGREDTKLTQIEKETEKSVERGFKEADRFLESAQSILKANDVTRVLERGFSITRKEGELVTDPGKLKTGDEIETRTVNGIIRSEVK